VRSIFALFDKPKAAPSIKARLDASSTAERQPTSGLVVIDYGVDSEPRTPLALTLRVGDSVAPAFETNLAEGAGTGRLVLHGHLLPNGPARLTLEAKAGREVVARREITVRIRNQGEIAEAVRDSLKARKTALVIDGPCDSSLYDYGDPALTAWYDREPELAEAHIADLERSGAASPQEAEALRQFAAEGYLVLPDVVDAKHLRRLNEALDDAVARKVEGYEFGSSQRMHNLHQDYPAVRDLWLHPKVMRMLELIFGVPARPCQSLTYVFGSQQQHHQDTIHLTPFPAGRMCGVWTALEDVQPDSGELVVFPGSHRLQRVYMQTAKAQKVVDNDWEAFGETVVPIWTSLIQDNKLRREVYQPKAGTVLIWHENLMHAGSVRKDMSKSRRSIVGHYFAQGSVVYYDSSGQPGSVYEPA
jgi:ectoine hydroxylase-related dioxygenase (phytanoyl-CoA dioxygenase family)